MVQRTSSVARIDRIRQRAARILLRRMSRADSGVAIRLSQVARVRSLTIPSAALPAAASTIRKASGAVMNRRYTLNSVRAASTEGLTPKPDMKNRMKMFHSGGSAPAIPEP